MIKNMNTATIRKPSATSIATPRPRSWGQDVVAITGSVDRAAAHSHGCVRKEMLCSLCSSAFLLPGGNWCQLPSIRIGR